MSSAALELPAVPRAAQRASLAALGWVLGAFVLALVAPELLFVLGPASFGVLHVAADYRYLVVRPGLPAPFTLALGVGSLALVLVRAFEAMIPKHLAFARLEVAMGFGLALLAVVFAARGGASRVRALALASAVLGVGALAVSSPLTARLVFAHAHNVIGVALFCLFWKRARRPVLPVLAAVALGTAALAAAGALAPSAVFSPWNERLLFEMKAALPREWPPEAIRAVGTTYVFLQMVHYGVWLVMIPLVSAGSLDSSPSAVLAGWRRDLGPTLFFAAIAGALLVFGASFVEVHRTRQLYLSLATFHGYLELAAAAFLVASRRPLMAKEAQ
jgi:hypothetical protein